MLITLVITKLPTEIPDSITIGDEILLDPDAMKGGIKRDGKILPI